MLFTSSPRNARAEEGDTVYDETTLANGSIAQELISAPHSLLPAGPLRDVTFDDAELSRVTLVDPHEAGKRVVSVSYEESSSRQVSLQLRDSPTRLCFGDDDNDFSPFKNISRLGLRLSHSRKLNDLPFTEQPAPGIRTLKQTFNITKRPFGLRRDNRSSHQPTPRIPSRFRVIEKLPKSIPRHVQRRRELLIRLEDSSSRRDYQGFPANVFSQVDPRGSAQRPPRSPVATFSPIDLRYASLFALVEGGGNSSVSDALFEVRDVDIDSTTPFIPGQESERRHFVFIGERLPTKVSYA